MKVLIKFFKYFLIILLFLFIVLFVYGIKRDIFGIQNGYKFRDNVDSVLVHRITKLNQTIVGESVINIDYYSNYIVGLRLPLDSYFCDGVAKKNWNKKKEYFILNTESNNVFRFESRDIFESQLLELNIFNNISLDYSKFDKTLEKYMEIYEGNKIDSKCKPSEIYNGTLSTGDKIFKLLN